MSWPSTPYEGLGFARARVEKVVPESPSVKSFYLEVSLPAKPLPGQFVMVWLPGAEEVPMSVSDVSGDVLRLSVARRGATTGMLHEVKEGGLLFLRGPFGTGFELGADPCLLVGGGYGAPPLIYAAKILSQMGKEVIYLIGAKSAPELLFVQEAKDYGAEVIAATEDGSLGRRGRVTDLLGDVLAELSPGSILTCGPELMMYEVARRGAELNIEVQASLDRYMKCGFGVCGSCVLDPLGLLVCKDGPVFKGEVLLRTDFGKWKHGPSGAKVRIR